MTTSPQPAPASTARVALVTGASSGIGRATAIRLAASGWHVALVARRADELHAAVRQIDAAGGLAFSIVADVARPADIERVVATTLETAGRIDALVNVAGIGYDSSVAIPDELLVQMVEVNLLAPMRLMRSVIPGMREAGRGSIVNIGSVAGEIGVNASYSATKFGLRGAGDAVRRELVGSGIHVSLVEPGYIATAMTAHRKARMPGPEVVAAAVERVIDRPRRRLIVPARYRLAVFVATVFPALVDRLYSRLAALE